jgi:uncharacterized protein (TIGR03437 family)
MRKNLEDAANGQSFPLAPCQMLCGVLRQTILFFVFLGVTAAQTTLTFNVSQMTVDTGILQVVTGDFNRDGNTDVVLLSAQHITLLLGNGDGTFQAPIQTPVTGTFYSAALAVGDFNNDGKLDLVLSVNRIGIQQNSVLTYLGRGDGTFGPPINSASNSLIALPPIVGDVNHDGYLDLIGPGLVALGAGDGTFPQVIASKACFAPAGLPPNSVPNAFAVADFRGQGKLDVALLEVAATVAFPGESNEYSTLLVCPGVGDGTFTLGPDVATSSFQTIGSTMFAVLTGDFNGDSIVDLLTLMGVEPNGQPATVNESVYFGHGNETFQTSGVGQSVVFSNPVVADMNADGKSDLVVIDGSTGVGVFLSNGDGTFSRAAAIPPAQATVSIAVADFNNDGLPDIVATGASLTSIMMNPSPGITSVLNAASLAPNQPVAPGSLVSILGAHIGPAVGVSGTGANASLPDSLAGVSVTFNGIPAPLSYVSAQQINAQIPWEINSKATVVITVNNAPLPPFQVTTAPIAPGVYATPSGQALAFNADGTIAGPTGSILGVVSHPAVVGGTLTVFANGLGPVTPAIADGVASSDVVRSSGSTPVFIGGVPCDVTFAGLSSTAVGVNQLSVIVPAGVHGVVPLIINAGGIITPANATIAIQ